MFSIERKDLFKDVDSSTVIAHGCNMLGIMGGGFALQIKERYPWAYKKYHDDVTSRELGDVIWARQSGEPIIANCLTQRNIGMQARQLNYGALCSSLISLSDNIPSDHFTLRLPLIGGGLAGGERDIIVEMMHGIFTKSKLRTILYLT